ncbi:MAG: cytochrome c3 family protein [Acidobacteriota bacterium]|nr:MAG: cytochrome c3 family protein [Acidobacteriota bacterium]
MTRENGEALGAGLDAWPESIHGMVDLSCVDCHADPAAAEMPHPAQLDPPDCSACHSDAAEQHATSVHGATVTLGEGSGVAAACWDCHGAHDVLPSSDPESRTSHFAVPKTCGQCHSEPHSAGEGTATTPGAAVCFDASVHGHALLGAGLRVAPNCATCHGSHQIRRPSDPESRVHRAAIPDTCGSCHEAIRRQYADSVHGALADAGNTVAAICTDCHTYHQIGSPDLADWKVDVIGECGTCHEESLETYRDTFHGQVTSLGFARVATCSGCHGSHDILPKDAPGSRVSVERRLATCQECHTRAGPNFVQYDPHPKPEDAERDAKLYYTGQFMKVLLIGVFSFFFLHTALWLPRSFKARREHHRRPSDRFSNPR